MFNPERLLGQLLGDALGGRLGGRRGRKRGAAGLLGGLGGGKAALGLGLLGVAMAAIEHFGEQKAANAPPGATLPPPPPGAGTMPPPPPAQAGARSDQAMHLLRAMITAAHADGLMDPTEREAILGRARDAGLDADDLRALDAEMSAPFTLEQLVVRTPAALRTQTYAAALVAITADTAAEREFLSQLGGRLGLDEAARRDLHVQLGLDAA